LPEDQLISRRTFVSRVGASAAGLVVAGGLSGCGEAKPTGPAPPLTGTLAGRVLDAGGNPQPLSGTIYLLHATGQQSGQTRIVDPFGKFDFTEVPVGDWQLRFQAPGVAYVPPQYEHPRRVSVRAKETTEVDLTIERTAEVDDGMIEIYVGDYFFQEQPQGKENAQTVVKVGTAICWYNVGLMPHVISGSWGESPVLARGGNYIWTPTNAGLYAYRCSYHSAQMIATLRVVAD
jgi:plastocyanin